MDTMKRIAFLVGLVAMPASAQTVPAIDLTAPAGAAAANPAVVAMPAIDLLSQDKVTLGPKEARGVALAEEWKGRPDMPARGDEGTVTFAFGASLPSVVCSPLYVCDIRLQAGEVVNQMDIGDGIRWKVTPASSGAGPHLTTHLMVKPVDVGLSTNVVVNTDRRTYTIRLVSDKKKWMPAVAFHYPEDAQAAWAAHMQRQAEQRHRQELPGTGGANIAALDFGFAVDGDAPWRPMRVYSDGIKTYIQFPPTVKHDEAPALVAIGPGDAEQLVNYRMVGDRYVVDKVLTRAALISGVGGDQLKVTIDRDGGRR